MKIANIQPLSLSDFPPYCSAIIFTIGCNLRCHFCHNKDLWNKNYSTISEECVFDFLKNKIGKLDGVVITGGEPTIQKDLVPFAEQIKQLGYKIKLNTNGLNPSCLEQLITKNLLDYVAMDVKAPLELYPNVCDTKIMNKDILKSIDLITNSALPHEFRTIWDEKFLNQKDIENIKKLIPIKSNHIIKRLSATGTSP